MKIYKFLINKSRKKTKNWIVFKHYSLRLMLYLFVTSFYTREMIVLFILIRSICSKKNKTF
jgi:hypothetical protein